MKSGLVSCLAWPSPIGHAQVEQAVTQSDFTCAKGLGPARNDLSFARVEHATDP